ncbi:radical SAM protein [Pseudothermotoga sp. U03pept]|uniref:radical SAM protein n=1 Tax=Pseudothermotoga sp. U03pept TaxID=3447012 RepID=UPI003EFC4E38
MKTFEEMEKFIQLGYRSFLISGGLNSDGEIPYSKAVLDKLLFLKEKYDLQYNFHIGFPNRLAAELQEIADVISFDFFSDREIMKKIYGLYREPMDQINVLTSTQISAIPHITIGVDCGKITHELESLHILSEYFSVIVLNVFIPTLGTHYANCLPPKLDDVRRVFEYAKGRFKVVTLGCMQPRGVYRLHLQNELRELADVIVKPVKGCQESFEGCCAFLLKQISQGVFSNVR